MMTVEQRFETRCISSLSKVFADEDLKAKPFNTASALHNETYSFQVAYRTKLLTKSIRVKVMSDFNDQITVRTVGFVPSELPCYHDYDEAVLRTDPGLYPDPLYPLDVTEGISGLPGQWRSVWITVDLCEQVKPGWHAIQVVFESDAGETLGQEGFELEVIEALLPKQKLIHTEWFHADCLATYYNVDVFSEEHWSRIDQYVQTAVKHGVNMILTPLFTPPLDTLIGGERPTVQLIDVEKSNSTWQFGFERLERWVKLCSDRGIEYFEFSHLFTQWGAKHAPKIIGIENGQKNRLFGWETDAAGDDYREFLSHFLPELLKFVERHNLDNRSYFHVSDEPRMEHWESYRNASDIVRVYLKDYPVIDALSDYSFYEKGLVKNPIPSNDCIEPFLKHEVADLWTYYCCLQYKEVSNRFFNMPSARNRILGIQLYKFNITGFLHWGFNFWYSRFSKKAIDPYLTTDADHGFPSGDAFLVYPGKEGPIESIRLEVLFEALQDVRALQLLESLIGREEVMLILEDGLDESITFNRYPQDKEWLLSLRDRINRTIKEHV